MVVGDAEEIEELIKTLNNSATNFDFIAEKVRINRELAIQDMAKIWNVPINLSAAVINSLFPKELKN